MESLRCVEFFSGIGGYHFSLLRTEIPFEIVGAFDVNSAANEVYKYIFGLKANPKAIDVLKKEDIDKFKADFWLMSPPCQPFTRGGKVLDHLDNRSLALLNLIKLLSQVDIKPKYIMLENVKNFEISKCREILISKLDEIGYYYEEYLISSTEFGVPNNRLRYYLVAKLSNPESLKVSKGLITQWKSNPTTQKIGCFLEDDSVVDYSLYQVPPSRILRSKNFKFDIVDIEDKVSTCFTKAYSSSHIYSSGALIKTSQTKDKYDFEDPSSIIRLNLRYFTPTEIAMIHGLPIENRIKNSTQPFWKGRGYNGPYFEFPDNFPIPQKYRLLGNGLNIIVVSEIMIDFLNKNK